MKEKYALEYLKKHHIDIQSRAWYHKKRQLREYARAIIYQDAEEFEAKHVERTTTLRYLLDLSYENLEKEQDPIRRQRIIESIRDLQYDIASFDNASRDIIEKGKAGVPVAREEQHSIVTTAPLSVTDGS